MYGIGFIKNSEYLKESIASGKFSHLSVDGLWQRFEGLRSKRPYVFNIETTNYCNMRCKMCPRTKKMTRPIQWFDRRYYRRILDQIIPYTSDELGDFFRYIQDKHNICKDEQSENAFYFYIASRCLTLHGYGEAVLDPHIAELVQICSERKIPTYLSCVPTNINAKRITELMKAGLTVIKFSIDAMEDETMKGIRGEHSDFSTSYEKILETIEIKKSHPEYKTRIVCTMISLSSSIEQRQMEEDFLRCWRSHGVYAYIKTQDNRWFYEQNDRLSEVSLCTKEYCEYPWSSLTIMSDGSVVPCTQDYDCEMVMGNIKDQPLEEIWNSQRYQDFRKMHISGNFPSGSKCVDRCDQALVYDRLKGAARTYRVI